MRRSIRSFPVGRSIGAAIAMVLIGGAGSAQAAASPPFASHQALYDLNLLKSRSNATISSARGRIAYRFTGNSCDGYTSVFRQVSELDSDEGKVTLSDMQSTSWESSDGKSYKFKIDTRMNGSDAQEVEGTATRIGDKITVKLKQPQAKTFDLDGSIVFPTEQIRRIIAAAREGKSLLELDVYDGSDNGQKVYNTLAVIGKAIPGDTSVSNPDPSTENAQMRALTRWPVTVSYFDRGAKQDSGEQTPVYTMAFELYENGVSRALKLDYNDFVVAGKMDKFDFESSKPCK